MNSDNEKPKVPDNVVTVRLADHDERSIQSLDQSGLGSVLAAIMGDDAANRGLSDIVLKGGTVRAASLGEEVAWTKTVWRRSGPLLTEEPLINPVDLVLPVKGSLG